MNEWSKPANKFLIIIIIKYVYIAQDWESCKCAGWQLQMEQVCLKSVSERRQRDVWCTKFSRKTVPHPRSLDSEAAVAV